MIDKTEVFELIKETIVESCGVNEEEVLPNSTLFADLNINSIDMMDILYTVEMEYDISIRVSDIEQEARAAMGGKDFEQDGFITPDGLEILKEKYPEIPADKLVYGITITDLLMLITVDSMVSMVVQKIEAQE